MACYRIRRKQRRPVHSSARRRMLARSGCSRLQSAAWTPPRLHAPPKAATIRPQVPWPGSKPRRAASRPEVNKRVCRMTRSSPVRAVFSALYAESDDFLEIFVRNFLLFTGPEALLVVNLPARRTIASRSAAASDRVHVILGAIARAKVGHTLLAGHLESLQFATELLGQFDYFCPVASNSLFVRRFDLEATEAMLAVPAVPFPAAVALDDLPDHWWWKILKEDGRLAPFMQARWGLATACSYQIEGNFAGCGDWLEVGRRLDQMLAVPELVSPALPFPVEEILPATVFQNFGSRRYTRICNLYWERGPAAPVTIADIVEDLWRMPREICIAKWFERDVADLATAAVTTNWSAELLLGLSDPADGAARKQRLTGRLMLEELGRSLRRQEGFEPFTQRWSSRSAPADDRTLRFRHLFPAGYHVLTLDESLTTDTGEAAAFVIAEEVDRPLDLEVRIARPTTEIRIVAHEFAERGAAEAPSPLPSSSDADDPEAALAGYLYFNPLARTHGTAIRVRIPDPPSPAALSLLGRLVLRHGARQSQLTERRREQLPGQLEAYFMIDHLDLSGGFWLGLPFFRGCSLDLVVEVL